ncbi:MAG TPA: condensation domain-containing protein, partial [Thermoanaerobaculia bacterium]|nr:condensation domain-containing protein [Thermoanaerobaculia bacterium]
RPITNVTLHVLDRAFAPVPAGVAGELHIGGAGLARGYLGRPDLTAERFVPDPFATAPGERLYRTGDRARWLADGNVDFLGRVDHQVKIRGFRIELGEIEAALRSHAAVREAAVVVRGEGDRRLVAFVVPGSREPGLVAILRSHLAGLLPAYMVPAGFVELEALPLTPGGKLDRRALARQVPEAGDAEPGFEAPWTPAEEMLAGIWTEVLGLARAGRGDSFFELGGHSLLATRVASRIRDVFQVSLPLRELFEHPRLGDLARRIEAALADTEERSIAPPILRVSRSRPAVVSFAQERLWFLDQLEPGSTAYSIPSSAPLLGPLDFAALETSLSEIVRRHEVLRTTFARAGAQPVQVIAPPAPLRIPRIDLSGLPAPEDEVARLGAEDADRPFDLERGPLLRVALLRLGDERHHLLVCFHHIIGDGWSTGILIRELGELYSAAVQGRRPALPELPIQYMDYAVWQRAWMSGKVLAGELAYWKQRLAGSPPPLRLPADQAGEEGVAPGGDRLVLPLGGDLSAALADVSRREGVTLFMTLLAGFQALLYRLTGERDVVVGSAIAGRNRSEIEGLIGFFINMLVMRTDLSGNPRFRELLGRVRAVALEAYAHQDLPFEKLIEELGAADNRSLFQIAFGLQNAHGETLELPGLRIGAPDPGKIVPRFDLTVWVLMREEGLQAAWTYRTDRFSAAAVERMHARYERLLQGAVAAPDERIDLLDLQTEAERAHRLAEEKAREQRQVEQLFNVRRRSVRLPQTDMPAEQAQKRTEE